MDPVTVALQVASVAFSAYSAYEQSRATKQAYEYQARVAENNAKIAQWQAEDAIRRGQEEEAAHRMKVAQLAGKQNAELAARGLDVGFGSALDILTGTYLMGEVDAGRIRENAARESWGRQAQAMNYQADAGLLQNRANRESPGVAAFSTLLDKGSTVADRWNTYKQNTGKWPWEA